MALSHHVFLNKLPDSLIASFTHTLLIIIRGKEKKVRIFHAQPTSHTIILQTIEFSQNFF
jgi:hypothetical protein